MGGQTPCLRVAFVLRQPCRRLILLDMENFSTPRQPLVPRLVNLATLVVVVSATLWSNAQRPAAAPAEANLAVPAVVQKHPAATPQPNAAPAQGATLVNWPAKNTAIPRDGLQAVGYGPANRR
jgi:hypothetical protein